MADDLVAAEIAVLGRICGIAPEFCDNSGGRHRTSLATFQALLSAMGVPWEDPERRREEVARRRAGPWSRFLEPVQVLAPATPGKINLYWFTPAPDLPSPLQVQATLAAPGDPDLAWQREFHEPPVTAGRAVPGGFRHRLELPLPWELPVGYYDLHLRAEAGGQAESGRTRLLAAPAQTYVPDCLRAGQRRWGFNLPLYALRGARNWGIGDFSDLLALTDWAASLGASFVGVNPLHAMQPRPEADPSPYAPTSRLFYNFLYLDLEKVPEMGHCPEVQALVASEEFQAELARLREGPLVPYPQVYRRKRHLLALLLQAFEQQHGPPEIPRTPRGREFARFLQEKGDPLRRFGEFCALADFFQESDWRRWPEAYHHPGHTEVGDFARQHPQEIRLYQYGQWLATTQLQQVSEIARLRGLPFTLYQDLALGADAGGFDTWAWPELFARGAAMGAPPDAFSPKGQNWGIPPIIPQALRESGYQLFIDTLRANGPEDGMLRLDHVMGLFRLLWIPAGMEPAQGAYVYYPAREMLAVLALESIRRRLLIIGEDLGTVSPRVRRDLGRLGVFSYRVFYFEREPDGRFRPPETYPAQAVAAVTTHDLPTLAGFCQGGDLAFRREAHLYPDPHLAETDASQRQHDRRLMLEALKDRGLLPPDPEPRDDPAASCPPQVREGVLEYLAQGQAALLEVRLEEVFGWDAQQNFPGTREEHPNWRRRLPLTLEEMARRPEPRQLADRLNKFRGRGPQGEG